MVFFANHMMFFSSFDIFFLSQFMNFDLFSDSWLLKWPVVNSHVLGVNQKIINWQHMSRPSKAVY